LDLAQPGAIESAVPRVVEHWGALHILVANAPGPPSGTVADVSVGEWQRAIDVNVLSMVRLTKAALPVMKAQGDGRINYITTIGVRTAQPAMVLSNSTRLAIVGLAKTLSLEVARDGILVNVFAPGPIATDRMDELITQTMERNGTGRSEAESQWLEEVPLGRMGQPHDLASVVALLSSPRCSFTTGAVISVDGGKSRAY
jgi:3-oxoacyl-[acyl-carrier protein] reductase